MPSVDKIESDIKSLKIQGATNVALAVLEALEQAPDKEVGTRLAYARPTEPLAQNAIRYIFSGEDTKARIQQYKSFISEAKTAITRFGSTIMQKGATYLTHCHASTVTNVFLNAHREGKNVGVIATETRPLMQGRITVKELLDGGLTDVTMIVDSAAASVLADPAKKIAAVFVGADLLAERGFVNKIGTLPIVTAAVARNIPVYCFSTLLKFDPTPFTPDRIEMRPAQEVWPDAPSELKTLAPAFDFTPYGPGISVVCEAGIISGNDVKNAVQKIYPFILL
jgi:ribose 1,5-bisphosphate isomerase